MNELSDFQAHGLYSPDYEHDACGVGLVRKEIERRVAASPIIDKSGCYFASLSTSTLIYKGMLTSRQLREYFPDLTDPYFTRAGYSIPHSLEMLIPERFT